MIGKLGSSQASRRKENRKEGGLILLNTYYLVPVVPQLDVKSQEVIKESKDWSYHGVRSEINHRESSGCW